MAETTWTRLPYTGDCDTCRIHHDVIQDIGEEWAAAARADQPPLSDQMRRALAMYGEHVAAHLPTTDSTETPDGH